MKSRTDEEIIKKAMEIWPDLYLGDVAPIQIKREGGDIFLRIANMYEPPGLTFEIMEELSKFFDTEHINDDERFSSGGCESCDYGSEHGFTLTIRGATK